MNTLRVHLALGSVRAEELAGAAAVVIDLVRASTTIVHALGAGAAAVVPCEEVAEAVAGRERHAGCLLGGERGGVLIPGFDLGNSPSEYTRERVGGKVVVFTTTNGTRALKRASAARRVLVGAFANFNAVVGEVVEGMGGAGGGDVHLVCAGIHGEPCQEDTLCAGAMAEAIAGAAAVELDDGARVAQAVWREHGSSRRRYLDALQQSRGGRNLAEVGLHGDLEAVSWWDTHQLAPELDAAAWRITAALPRRRTRLFLPEPS